MTETTLSASPNSAGQSTHRDSRETARDAIRAVAAALVTAWPLELLLRSVPLGVNVPLAAIAVACALLYATRGDRATLGTRIVLMCVFVALAAIAAVRAPSLLWLAMAVALVATMVLAAAPLLARLRGAEPIEALARAVVVMARVAGGPLWIVTHAVDWSSVMPSDRSALRHARGAALAIPLLLPFLALFASADPAFDAIARSIIDLPRLFTHAALWAFFAWFGLGWLGVAVFPSPSVATPRVRLGSGEGLWMLGALTLLFAAFVAVQFRYFYGGAELVQAVAGMSYAEYARRGFFELVTVAALLLIVLLGVDWLTQEEAPARRRRLRQLSLVLIALLAVILVSALRRMALYVDTYGLTELRFFTTAFMLWMVAIFGWFMATVMRDRPERFIAGVYASGVAMVLLLAAIDPIGRIAAYDVEHGRRTGRFDGVHLSRLGADAVPVLMAALDDVPADQRCATATSLLQWVGDDDGDFDARSWNLSRERARALVLPRAHSLARECDPPVELRGGL